MEAPFFKELDVRLRKQVGASAKLIRLREEASLGSAQHDEVRSQMLPHFEVILSNWHWKAQGLWCVGPAEAQMDCTVLGATSEQTIKTNIALPRYQVNLTFRVWNLSSSCLEEDLPRNLLPSPHMLHPPMFPLSHDLLGGFGCWCLRKGRGRP